ncbi:NAD(P)H-dependent oxidoreductase [Clostridium psychrophilum]|uniref:NAD(P)H-dependent oxidoreductase n=1 Tax=Clostridium psychrophilum TaxID=132926 RepID=UPI001C0C800D|nr:NAD(P)-dependent oxidoreductase [Clostridium psychrophilum]MBU3179795.1 NAD(P)-dependent oxidoreductase [Clostridium psychrophilum]
MLGLNYKLRELEEKGKRINISVVGAGQMGKGMVSQIMLMKGVTPSAVVDINLESAKDAYLSAGVSEDNIAVANSVAEANKYMEQGKFIVTQDSEIASKCNLVDVAIDATGVPEVGAKVAIDAINNKKHIVMLNVETDVCIGPILKKLADNAGVVYTGSAGDEPGAVKELYDFADSMGFDVNVVGKGKNNKLDFDCNPDTVKEEAIRRGVSPHMLTSFKDGTKTMVELTCMSNATGYLPDIRGSHGASAVVKDLPELFRLKSEGGILTRNKTVEFVNGVAPGVFVIVSSKLPAVRAEMEYLSMGKGPNYVLYRPYHLCSLETPLSAVRCVLDQQSTIVPIGGPVSEVITLAKIDLKAGQTLDGIGGYTVYGTIESAKIAKEINAVPLGLINRKTLLKVNVKKGEVITYDMIDLDGSSLVVQLRALQDRFF